MKKCYKCKQELPLSDFPKNSGKKDGLGTECRPCRKVYLKSYYAKNREKMIEQNSRRGKERHREARQKVMHHYSGGTMVCGCKGCEESHEEFLTIEHINGGGNKERKEFKGARTFYEYLVKMDYPDGLMVLCYNCNCSKGAFGYCPHEREKT